MRYILLLAINLLITNSLTPMNNNDDNKIINKFIFINRIATNNLFLPKDITNHIKTLLYLSTKKEIYNAIELLQDLQKKHWKFSPVKILPSSLSSEQAQSVSQLLTSKPSHLTSQTQYQSFLEIPYRIRQTIYLQHERILVLNPTEAHTAQEYSIKSCFKQDELQSCL
jgi:hypothetical protein